MFERSRDALTSLDILSADTDTLPKKAYTINRNFGYSEIGRRKILKPIDKDRVIEAIDRYIKSTVDVKSQSVVRYSHTRRDQKGVDVNIASPSWLIREKDRASSIYLDSDGELIVYSYNERTAEFWLNSIIDATKDYVYPDKVASLFIREVVGLNRTMSGTEVDMKEISLDDTLRPHMDLYPHFKTVEGFDLDMFVEEYLISKESVILNYGPPGTGKTTFSTGIARMALEMEGEAWSVFLYRNNSILSNTALLNEVIGKAEDKTIFIFEDMDQLLLPRTSKSGNEFMASLLNISAGMDDRNIKFIFNTNQLNLDRVDEALYRPGRCFAKIYSGFLAEGDINPARVAVGKPEVDTSAFIGKRISLAQALSINPRNETGLREFGEPDLDKAFFTNQLIAQSRFGLKPDMEVETAEELPTVAKNKTTALVIETGQMFRYKKSEQLWKEIVL